MKSDCEEGERGEEKREREDTQSSFILRSPRSIQSVWYTEGSDSRLTWLKGVQGSQVVAAVCSAR